MTLAELIERLEEMQDVYGEDAEVRLMTQQQWPFENDIRGVTTTSEMHGYDDDVEVGAGTEDIVYIVEGGQLGYGNKAAWDAC